jgi:hypothetical protein
MLTTYLTAYGTELQRSTSGVVGQLTAVPSPPVICGALLQALTSLRTADHGPVSPLTVMARTRQ